MIPQHTLPQNPVMPQSTFPQNESCASTANILEAEDQTVTLPGLSAISESEFNVDGQTMGEVCAVTHPDMPVMSDSNSDVIVESEPSIATTIHLTLSGHHTTTRIICSDQLANRHNGVCSINAISQHTCK